MKIYYSKTTNSFYNDRSSKKLPADAVQITTLQHKQLLHAAANGQQISADATGKPINIPAAGPTSTQIWKSLQTQAQTALTKSDTVIIRCAENGIAVPAAWVAYRASLRAIISSTTGTTTVLPAQPAYPTN